MLYKHVSMYKRPGQTSLNFGSWRLFYADRSNLIGKAKVFARRNEPERAVARAAAAAPAAAAAATSAALPVVAQPIQHATSSRRLKNSAAASKQSSVFVGSSTASRLE